MPERLGEVVRQYWPILLSVVGLIVSTQLAIQSVQSDVRELRAVVNDNLVRLNQFAQQGPRYTLKDHFDYSEKQAAKDAEQDRRLTILEQKGGR